MPFQRTFAEVLRAHGDALRDDMRVMLPAVVTDVHPDRQTVDVQISVQNPLFDEFGNKTFETLPGIADVPLATMRGGKFFVWMPVQVGDSVMLVFSDLSMDTWRASGTDQPVAPAWVGKHTVDSCVAIPCIAPDSKSLSDPDSNPDKLIVGCEGKDTQILIDDTTIELGKSTTDFVALAAKIDLMFNVLTAAYTPAATEPGFAALVTALAAWKVTNWTTTTTVAADLVKGQ